MYRVPDNLCLNLFPELFFLNPSLTLVLLFLSYYLVFRPSTMMSALLSPASSVQLISLEACTLRVLDLIPLLLSHQKNQSTHSPIKSFSIPFGVQGGARKPTDLNLIELPLFHELIGIQNKADLPFREFEAFIKCVDGLCDYELGTFNGLRFFTCRPLLVSGALSSKAFPQPDCFVRLMEEEVEKKEWDNTRRSAKIRGSIVGRHVLSATYVSDVLRDIKASFSVVKRNDPRDTRALSRDASLPSSLSATTSSSSSSSTSVAAANSALSYEDNDLEDHHPPPTAASHSYQTPSKKRQAVTPATTGGASSSATPPLTGGRKKRNKIVLPERGG